MPVTTVTPSAGQEVWEIAAVLTSPVASIAAWQHGAGTGLSTTSVRVGPASLAATPWPAGSLDPAVAALRQGELVETAHSVCCAFGLPAAVTADLVSWWAQRLPGAVRD